ncbi:nuclear transport factor 2 family protein [Niveibacterium sp. COAC-50]|uniref:nuclear transport factor 2 family protein n=1 Tax=Niveibacterium sp. COAC-50 TaxID=2729384 RepID=UPI001551AB6D|nr:nuclear transport factor 2 family protein [Niveibacterium sp. COAC-50]
MSIRLARLCRFALVLVCLMPLARANSAQDDDALRATLDAYVDGWYAGDAARLEAVTHPDLIRRKPALVGTSGAIQLEEIDQLGLLGAARSGIGRRAPEADRVRMTTEVLAQRGISAMAVVETGGTFSYLQLVKNAGRWQVLNALWEPKLDPADGRDMREADAVASVVQDYALGWYEGNAAQMQAALHPALLKRKPALLNRAGEIRIEALDAAALIAATRAGGGRNTPADMRGIAVKVLDIRGRSAIAVLETRDFFDFLALTRDKGRWQIVNALWEPTLE